MLAVLLTVVVFAVCFLLGSVPWGLIFSKVLFKQDVREHGSGNIGTTNMMRTYGKGVGIAVFVLDFGKGVLGSAIAWAVAAFVLPGVADAPVSTYFMGQVILAISFAGCVWGHIFCPWLGFKGGKGIATSVGCEFIVLGPFWAVVELLIFFVLMGITKYVSVGSIVAAFANLPISLFVYWGNPVAILANWLPALTVVWAHRANFKRLLNHEENKIGSKKKAKNGDAGDAGADDAADK